MHGTAMESPVLVVIANLVMEDIKQKAMSAFHTARFWRQYIDDTYTVLPGNLGDSFLRHLSNINSNIQFTVEKESDGQLPFLDILLTMEEGGSISTSVYCKTIHIDQYLNFESHHTAAYKRAVDKTLMHRAESLPLS